MALTDIQIAMCEVIKETGFEGLNKVKLNNFQIVYNCFIEGQSGFYKWVCVVDGNLLTSVEYKKWLNMKR